MTHFLKNEKFSEYVQSGKSEQYSISQSTISNQAITLSQIVINAL